MAEEQCDVEEVGGTVYWRRKGTGELLFVRSPAGLFDHRKSPPYKQLLPCPYCLVEQDKGHHPLKHTTSAILVYP